MPTHYARQPSSLFRDREVRATPEFGFHLSELRPHPSPHRLALEQEPSLPRSPANMRETEEVERLRLSKLPPAPISVRMPTELNQTGLVSVKLEMEPRETLAERLLEPLGIATMLEADHDVVGETHDDNVTPRMPPPPLVGPKVEDIVQINVRQQR